MLGWEFPPHITGGLGTACHGLTHALHGLGHKITFILPKPTLPSNDTGIDLIGPPNPSDTLDEQRHQAYTQPGLPRVRFEPIPAKLYSPYTTPGSSAPGSAASSTQASGSGASSFNLNGEAEGANDPSSALASIQAHPAEAIHSPGTSNEKALGDKTLSASARALHRDRRTPIAPIPSRSSAPPAPPLPPIGYGNQGPTGQYFGDILQETQRYAMFAMQRAQNAMLRGETFDVIHAHDWMTFPAGMAIAAQSGKPLIIHFHSTEYDRSGHHVDHRIADIERRACHAAMRIVAVSKYTRSEITSHYNAPLDRIDVVYNGITPTAEDEAAPSHTLPEDNANKTALFLGRITHQKGPEFFIRAAKKVLEKVPDARFVIAGSGDKMHEAIEQAAREGVGHRVRFTGFLRGAEVDRAFAMANVFVMPSVSEPFGIAALEAIRSDVPVIVSKQSGVSEVVQHALKVDFWDTDQMAEKIIAVLSRPALADAMTSNADREIKKLTWDGAAEKLMDSYAKAIMMMP